MTSAAVAAAAAAVLVKWLCADKCLPLAGRRVCCGGAAAVAAAVAGDNRPIARKLRFNEKHTSRALNALPEPLVESLARPPLAACCSAPATVARQKVNRIMITHANTQSVC